MPAYPDQRGLVQVMAADLRAGDVVLVKPGETIPADGRVIEGESTANESLLTGESAPVRKRPGVPVTGGAVNIESPLLVEVAQVGEGTRLSAIVRLMERAAMEKPRIVELADRIASRFIICLLFLAVGVAVAWSFIDPRQALWITVSVLVVSCPCALSLATPVALTVAGGAMAHAGLLVTRSHAIETLARATHFVFDKTGTLTTGEMHVLEVLPLGTLGREQSLALAAALEQASEHPIGKALRVAMAGRDMPAVEGLANEPGCGMKAQYGGRQVRVGRPDYVLKLHGRPLPDSAQLLLDGGDTVVALGDDTLHAQVPPFGEQLGIDGLRLVFEVDDPCGLVECPLCQRLLAGQLGQVAGSGGDGVAVRVETGMTKFGSQFVGFAGRKLVFALFRLDVPIGCVVARLVCQITLPQPVGTDDVQGIVSATRGELRHPFVERHKFAFLHGNEQFGNGIACALQHPRQTFQRRLSPLRFVGVDVFECIFNQHSFGDLAGLLPAPKESALGCKEPGCDGDHSDCDG